MIKVTVWNEYVQEQMDVKAGELFPGDDAAKFREEFIQRAKEIKAIHNGAIHNTLKALLEEDEEIEVRHIATLEMEECGLTKDVLDDTDVLVWWAHVAHDRVPDEIAERVRDYVLRGMGFIALHSAHPSKPMQRILGTSGSLQWREGDFPPVYGIHVRPILLLKESRPPLSFLRRKCMENFSIFQSRMILYLSAGTEAERYSVPAAHGQEAMERFSISSRATKQTNPILMKT